MASRLRLVLVAPLYAGNVGACARVAANFDIADIRIVAPQCEWTGEEARKYAKGSAASLLSRAREHATIKEALAGATAAVGFTRRAGQLRRATIAVEEIAEVTGPVALVFGREDSGLTKEELLACTHVCSFAVSEKMPSLNLSHAVAVAAARIFEAGADRPKGTRHAPAPHEVLETLVGHWREAMIDAGMTKAGNPERMLAHIRRALQRAELTSRDVAIFRGYLSKTQWAMRKRD
jgi:TrmH family RNA methyltransferase